MRQQRFLTPPPGTTDAMNGVPTASFTRSPVTTDANYQVPASDRPYGAPQPIGSLSEGAGEQSETEGVFLYHLFR